MIHRQKNFRNRSKYQIFYLNPAVPMVSPLYFFIKRFKSSTNYQEIFIILKNIKINNLYWNEIIKLINLIKKMN